MRFRTTPAPLVGSASYPTARDRRQANAATLPPKVDVEQGLPVEATFACSVCGKPAGLIRLKSEDGRTEVRRESWPGVAI